jgi:hypothetical protein
MAIVVDPDLLDRYQVIYATSTGSRKLSLSPVGTLRSGSNPVSSGSDGSVTSGSANFVASTAQFVNWGVVPGDVVCIFNSASAGHYPVQSVTNLTTLVLVTGTTESPGENSIGLTETKLIYDIRRAGSGTIVDGVTEQCVYSFSKEEWKLDSAVYGGDDLIRHEFPFEPITSEQFEIGGGTSHDSWSWFNKYTKKKVRTGGWDNKITAGTSTNQWAGIITLGSLQSTAQVYYQQNSVTTAPTNFTFLGPVNEAIDISGSGYDYRTFLKLFVRKKFYTYAGASISDIGVTTLQPIVNRFPLAHALDTAIVALDAQVVGAPPYRTSASLSTGVNGVTNPVTALTGAFTSSGATFITAGVAAGDTLYLPGGTWAGYYTIFSAPTETTLTVDTTEKGTWTNTTSNTFNVGTVTRVSAKTDGVLADVATTTGSLVSAGSNFTTSGVVAGDMVVITEAASPYRGVYKVLSVQNATTLYLDTTDKTFGAASNIDFYVTRAGMYLQSKEEALTIATTTGTLTFAASPTNTLTRTGGSWISDGVTVGTVIGVVNGTNAGKLLTVKTVDSATQLTFVTTDVVLAGTDTINITATDYFKRSVAGTTYAFKWRLFGNGQLATYCYEFIQHQLRQPTDIDYGPNVNRGDVTDLLMSYQAPTGLGLNLIIDNINANDTNNVSYRDATGVNRAFAYVAAGSISFNDNLQTDAAARYVMFFTNDNSGDNLGRDYGTPNAIIVQDATSAQIAGNVSGQPSVSFTYDYDGNVQRGATSAGTDAPVTIVAIGLTKAQFVITTGNITRAKGISFSLVSALERNYSNP